MCLSIRHQGCKMLVSVQLKDVGYFSCQHLIFSVQEIYYVWGMLIHEVNLQHYIIFYERF